jgi:hypothetical protein
MLTLLPLLIFLSDADPPHKSPLEVPLHTSEAPREIGRGYLKNDTSLEVKVSRAFGTTASGSNFSHDFWLTQFQGGLMLADVMEPEYWFGGNLEATCLGIIGAQDNPDGAYFLGANGGLRYHFRTGTAFAPYLWGNIGVAVTDIETPDSSGKFQFNEQIGIGTRYFLSPRHALTFEYGYWHISNGGIREPNDGVNSHIFTVGFAWIF